MKERLTTFNHGYLCQMLQAADDFQLARVIEDVKRERARRSAELRKKYADNILGAIREAIEAGYEVNFWTDGVDEMVPDYCIHANNLLITTISVQEEEDE